MHVIAIHHPDDIEAAQAWAAAQTEDGLDIETLSLDVSSVDDCATRLAELTQKTGPVDVLVNCAGITRDITFRKMSAQHWYDVINVNLNSAFNVTRAVWEDMLEHKYGRVVNISSVNGQRGQFGQTNYSAAKAGLHGFTMALAQEGAAKGITVNTVSPGYIETAMTAAMRDDVREAIVGGIPMRRMGTPDEIANVVAFLAKEESGYVTGANIPINGGLYMT